MIAPMSLSRYNSGKIESVSTDNGNNTQGMRPLGFGPLWTQPIPSAGHLHHSGGGLKRGVFKIVRHLPKHNGVGLASSVGWPCGEMGFGVPLSTAPNPSSASELAYLRRYRKLSFRRGVSGRFTSFTRFTKE